MHTLFERLRRTLTRAAYRSGAISLTLLAPLLCAGTARAIDHSDTISSDETWLAADNPHVVVANIRIDAGVTLTLEPGVEVRLDPNRRLEVRGELSSVGTAGQPILWTRNSTDWSYLYFTGSGSGMLEHCVIEHANYGIYSNSTGLVSANEVTFRENNYGIFVAGATPLTLTACEVRNGNYGVVAQGGSLELGSTSFIGNANVGLSCTGIAPTFADGFVTFEDNATGLYVEDTAGVDLTTPLTVTGSTTAGIHLDGCDAPALDNLVLTQNTGNYGALYLADCGEFTLGAGNTIGGTGQENSWPLSIGAGAYPAPGSAIPASGNTHDDIQIRGGASERSGTWHAFSGLDYVVGANTTFGGSSELTIAPAVTVRLDANRRLEFRGTLTAIGAAGQEIRFTRNTTSNWNYLYLPFDGSATLNHCIIEYATYGYYCNSSGNVSSTDVVFRHNDSGLYNIGDGIHEINGCQFQDNNYGVYATGGTLRLASTAFSGNADAGLYGSDVALEFLDANITFDGNATGLYLKDTAGVNLTTPLTVTGSTTAGIRLDGCDAPALDNLLLTQNTGTYGALYLADCGEFTLGAGNTIGGTGQENSWPLSIGAGAYPAPGSAIPASGNTRDDIQFAGNNSDRTGTLRPFPGLDYVVTNNPDILAGGVLNVDPGVVFRFAPNRRLQIRGTLNAIGVAGQEIVFTQDAASLWGYLYFIGDGAADLRHCVIEHAFYGIYAASQGTIATEAVTLRENGTGVYATSGTVTLLNDRIHDNTSYGIRRTGANVVFGSLLSEWNDLYDNGGVTPGRDFYNDNPADIEARWVYWGTTDHGQILDRIWDLHDDRDLGLVKIMPFSNATHDSPYSAIEDELPDRQVPEVFALAQNAPNPFNPQTVIRFDLPAAVPVQLKIYNVSGERVRTLIDEGMPAGSHEVTWRGRDDRGRQAPSGLYFYRMAAGKNVETQRMILIK